MDRQKEPHLNQLFVKLGHELEEIRRRALLNLLSKLDGNLVSSEELANEKYLHVRLLEWFNFPSWPLSREVLLLIRRLIHHNGALESFVQLNAFAFLSDLKSRLDADIQLVGDDILDCLRTSHNIQPCSVMEGCKFQQKPLKTELSDDVSTSQGDITFTLDSARQHHHHHHHHSSDAPSRMKCSLCFKHAYFPWVSLTSTDNYVLNTSFEALAKGKSNTKSDQCNFISDVLFQDFPAEVFLQRPQIIKALIDLIPQKHVTSMNDVETKTMLESITTLIYSCRHLRSRIQFHEDRDFFYPVSLHHDSNVKNPPTEIRVARLDTNAEQFDDSEWKQLCEHQWSLQEFCLSLLERIVHLFDGLDMTIFSKCSMLTSGINELLKRSIDKSNLWRHDHRDFKKRMMSLLKTFTSVVASQHRLRTKKFAESEVSRRHSFFFVLSIILFEMVENLVDMNETPITFQQDMFSCFALMHEDVFFEIGCPSSRERIKSFVSSFDINYVNSDRCHVDRLSDELISSLRSCCKFLNANSHAEDVNKSDLLKLAGQGLSSLQQHRSFEFIESSIRLASSIYSDEGSNNSDIFESKTLILKLLAFPDVSLQAEVYRILHKSIKDALDVNKFVSSKPNSTSVVDCLLDERIFYEIIAFGFSNLNVQIHDMSRDILFRLLQSKLLLPDNKWNKLMTCMEPLMPLLHSYAENISLLGKFILGMLAEDSMSGGESEMIRANMRMLFHKDSRLREMGLSNSLRSLMCEDDSSKKLPRLSSCDVFKLNDLFVVSCDFRERWNYFNYSIYKESDLMKVVSNFISPSVDFSTKISSSSQMSIMLCDPSLHKIFLSSNGLESIIKELQEALLIQNYSMCHQQYNSLVSNLMKCLLSIVVLNHDACGKLSSDVSFHLMLIRYGLMFASKNMEDSHLDVSLIVFLVLFRRLSDLIVSWHVDEPPVVDDCLIRIPMPISERYRVPFENSGDDYCKYIPWEMGNTLEVVDERLMERMRIVWGVAIGGGDVVKACNKGGAGQARFNEALMMSDEDREILRACVPSAAVSSTFSELEGARDHFSASRSVLRISTFLSFQSRDLEVAFPVGWMKALERFVSVAPSSPSDFLLLQDVIQFLQLILINITNIQASSVNYDTEQISKVHDWMIKHVLDDTIISLILMKSNEEPIKRHVLQLINQLVSSSKFIADGNLVARKDGSKNLTKVVSVQISEVGGADSFALSSLVNLSMILNHVTARSGWSSGDANLCNKVLQILLKNCASVVHCPADMKGWYVGRGVMKFTSSCLNNVANELVNHHHGDDWLKWWMYVRPTSETDDDDDDESSQKCVDSGFDWLFLLIAYGDVEVCSFGLSIATTLCSTTSGRDLLTSQVSLSHFRNIWEVALQILMDEAECYFVRRQATCLLLNLMNQLRGEPQTQHLVVRDARLNIRLVGVPCLMHLLRETKFYEMFALVLNSFSLELVDSDNQHCDQSSFNSRLSQMSDITEAGDGGGLRHAQAPPSFVRCLCDVLQNMVILSPSETLQDIERHQIIKPLVRSLTSSLAAIQFKINNSRHEINKWTTFLLDSLDLMTSFVDFIVILVDHDGEEVPKDVVFLKHLPVAFKLFTVFDKEDFGEELKMKAMRLVASCMHLLSLLVKSDDNSFRIISKVCDERWPVIKETLVKIISKRDVFGTDVWFSCLRFVTMRASEELKRSTSKNSEVTLTFSKNLSSSVTSESNELEFDEVMITMIQSFNFKSHELFHHKLVVLEALKALLMLSPSFRMKAFQAGLLNLVTDHLHRTTSSFNIDSNLEANKKEAKSFLQETQITIEVLHGLMFESPETKISACRRDLPGLISSLWRLCVVFRSLMSVVVAMLTCFTSHCNVAVSSVLSPSNKQTNVSLFADIMKFLQKEFASTRGNDYSLLQKTFQLLENLVVNSECRSLLAKSSFLADTARLIKTRSLKQTSQSAEEILWLKFLTGLSFFSEGQVMILKSNDILNMLLEYGERNISKISHQLSVLVVRNLCFHPNNKPKLLSNDKVLNFILKCLNDKSEQLISVACSALLELLMYSQKFRAQLKNNFMVRKRLQDLLEKENSKQQSDDLELIEWNLRHALQDIIIIVDS